MRMDVTSCYTPDFDAKSYLQTRFSRLLWHQLHILKWFREFFDKYLTMMDSKAQVTSTPTVMAEISGGPCIANMTVATPYVSEIVFSDYLQQNLKEVELWKSNDPSAYDWSPYLRYINGPFKGPSGEKRDLF